MTGNIGSPDGANCGTFVEVHIRGPALNHQDIWWHVRTHLREPTCLVNPQHCFNWWFRSIACAYSQKRARIDVGLVGGINTSCTSFLWIHFQVCSEMSEHTRVLQDRMEAALDILHLNIHKILDRPFPPHLLCSPSSATALLIIVEASPSCHSCVRALNSP